MDLNEITFYLYLFLFSKNSKGSFVSTLRTTVGINVVQVVQWEFYV